MTCWRAIGLALLFGLLGCSVYDESMLNGYLGGDDSAGASGKAGGGRGGKSGAGGAGTGGAGGVAGTAGVAGTGGAGGSSAGGGGTGAQGGGGAGSGGSAGQAGQGGEGDVGGSGGMAGSNEAGSGGSGADGAGSGGLAGEGGAGSTSGGLSLVDDMEDGDKGILNVEGREGCWYVDWDKGSPGDVESTLLADVMEAGDRSGSQRAAHMKASGFTSGWGATLGVRLKDVGCVGSALSYDVREYDALTFWAKSGFSREQFAKLRIRTATSTSPGVELRLTPTWQFFTVTFEQLLSTGVADIQRIEFSLDAPAQRYLNIWVDDLALSVK